jgi:hypothetical protein
MKLFNYLFAFFLLITSMSYGQNYNMTNGTISDCNGTFYDSGGTGNYSNNQNLEFTICPDNPANT